MAARHFSLALGDAPKRLSDVYGGVAGSVDALTDVAYRQLLLSTSGAGAILGQAASGQSGQYAALVLADGAEAYWRLEEANGSLSFADATGHGHTATITNAAGINYGVAGALGDGSVGLGLPGGSGQDRFTIAIIVIGTTFTVDLWVRPLSLTAELFASIITPSAGGNGLYFNHAVNKLDLNFGGVSHFNTTALTIGTLYHVAVSVAAGAFTFYVNGVADGTGTGWPGISVSSILTRVMGGGALSMSLVDELAYYTTALSAAQIQNHYALRGAPQSLNLPVTGAPLSLGGFGCGPLKLSNFTAIGVGSTLSILGDPLLMAARSYLLTLGAAPVRLSDVYGGTPGAFTPATDIGYRQLSFGVIGADALLGVANASGASPTTDAYAAQILADSPLVYWRVDEPSGNAIDKVSGQVGVASGTITYQVTGALANGTAAVRGDGAGASGIFTGPVLTLPAAFSMELWVFQDATTATNIRVLGVYGATVASLRAQGGSAPLFVLGASSVGGPLLSPGRWHHLVGTADGTNIRVYLDGALQNTVAVGGAPSASAVLFLGGQGTSMNGAIDEVAVYPYTLTPAQIAAHYALAASTTGPTLAHHLATTGAPLTLGPFETGPIKLSNFVAQGVGSTLSILGIPF